MATASSTVQLAPSSSDHALVAEVRRGSDDAFEELYSRYHARIGSFINGMMGDASRSEDVAQEVFISALRRMRDTERPIVFKPWIYEIAKNACIDEYRRSRRSREVPLELDAEPQIRISQVACSTTPEVAVETKQRLEDLRGAFEGLSETHHRILVLRELEGRSYREIGSQMGISKPTVESTLFRARQRLSEEYGELVSGRRCHQIQSMIAADEQHPLARLGVRARRQLARHLAHCQACRRQARAAGLDEQFFHAPPRSRTLAALLPFPWVRWRLWRRDPGSSASATQGSMTLARIQTVAQSMLPTLPSAGFGRAAAATAALVVGGGGVMTVASQSSHAAPAMHRATSVTAGTSSAPVSAAPLRGPAALPGRPARTAGLTDISGRRPSTSGPRTHGQSASAPTPASGGGRENPLAPVLGLLPGGGSVGNQVTAPQQGNGQTGPSSTDPGLPLPPGALPSIHHSDGLHRLRQHLRSILGQSQPQPQSRTGFDNHGDVPSGSGSGGG